MSNIIDIVYDEVKRRCLLPSNIYGTGAWDYHIKLVYEIAIKNYEKYNADYEIVALASLLHDIASVTDKEYEEDHHIIGAKIAEELLSNLGLEDEKIDKVKNCILNHRGSILKEKNTKEEILIADSDAMAHFYAIPSLLKMAFTVKHMSIDEGSKFVLDKLGRSYNKLSDIGKELVEDKYMAAKIVLSNI